jgi:hypothetical protein
MGIMGLLWIYHGFIMDWWWGYDGLRWVRVTVGLAWVHSDHSGSAVAEGIHWGLWGLVIFQWTIASGPTSEGFVKTRTPKATFDQCHFSWQRVFMSFSLFLYLLKLPCCVGWCWQWKLPRWIRFIDGFPTKSPLKRVDFPPFSLNKKMET